MLQLINDKFKVFITLIIIITLILAFLLTGIGYFFVSGIDNSPAREILAKVGKADILRKNYQKVLEQNLNNHSMNAPQLRQKILQKLINNALLRQDSKNSGIYITSEMLSEAIFFEPIFQENGKYSVQRFYNVAYHNGGSATVTSYFLDNLLATSVIKVIKESQFILESEVKAFNDLFNQSRKISYYCFEFNLDIVVDDEQLKTYYDAHESNFHESKQAIISYVPLSSKNFIDSNPISCNKIKEYYFYNKSMLVTKEQRQGQVIRINKHAKNKKSIISRLITNLPLTRSQQHEVTFIPLTSITVNQAKTYGDFKLFTLNKLLSVEKITEDKYIQFTNVIPANKMSLNESQPVIEKILRNRKGVENFNILMSRVTNDGFEKLVQEYKLSTGIKTSNAFSNGENSTGIEGNFNLQQAIFRKNKSEGFIFEDQFTGFIYKLNKIIPSRVADVMEIKDKVKQSYVTQQSDQSAKEKAEKFQQALKSGIIFKGLPKMQKKNISRLDYGIDEALKKEIFCAGLNNYQIIKNRHAYWLVAVTESIPGRQKNVRNSMMDNFYTSITMLDYISALYLKTPVQLNYRLI